MIALKKMFIKDKQSFICFVNDKGFEISIPIDRWHFDRIQLYLGSFSETSVPFDIEEKNNEEIEDDL